MNVFIKDDPYLILEVDKKAPFAEVKKKYFILAKKYHPDLNPNNERAKLMFMRVRQAYKDIEMQHNPHLRALHERTQNSYDDFEKKAQEKAFKSKRPGAESKQSAGGDSREGDRKAAYDAKNLYDKEGDQFLRRMTARMFVYGDFPLSRMNRDRHGLENLKADPTKPLDKIKMPPMLIYALVFAMMVVAMYEFLEGNEAAFDETLRKNIMMAMKKFQDKVEYGDDEVLPAEELQMAQKEYKLFELKKNEEEKNIRMIKNYFRVRESEKVDVLAKFENSLKNYQQSTAK